jgi:hypothetical protein
MNAGLLLGLVPITEDLNQSVEQNLVESYREALEQMAQEGKSDFQSVNSSLQKLMAKLRWARGNDEIDTEYFNRYRRLLVVATMITMDTSFDEEGILDEMLDDVFRSFVKDITGEPCTLPSRSSKLLSAISGAISQELLMLETHKSRK